MIVGGLLKVSTVLVITYKLVTATAALTTCHLVFCRHTPVVHNFPCDSRLSGIKTLIPNARSLVEALAIFLSVRSLGERPSFV